MALPAFSDHLHTHRLSPGRGLWAIARARERLDQLAAAPPDDFDAAALAPLAEALHEAEAAHQDRLRVRDAWAKRDVTDASAAARDLRVQLRAADVRVDRCVAALDATCASAALIFADDPAKAAAAARLRAALLPQGVAAVTQRSYVEQHAQVDLLLQAAEAHAADVALLRLEDHIAVTAQAQAAMGGLLEQLDHTLTPVTWGDVRAADAAAHEALCAVIAHILVALVPRHRALAARLLEPIEAQQDAMRAARRTNAPDINPTTGAPLEPAA